MCERLPVSYSVSLQDGTENFVSVIIPSVH